jgi:5-formyltetrahydrofolate cyclo-ligase
MTILDPALVAWRREQRKRLIAAREAMGPGELHAKRIAIDGHLRRGFPGLRSATLALCWPYRNEYDARHFAAEMRAAGATTLLPVVVARDTALQFRLWRPGVAMNKGALGIPYPKDTPLGQPGAVLLPMVGFDAAGYRLGYGGGYFDRTLVALHPRPTVIGVAHELARMETIRPQAHDITVDYLVTERGVYRRDNGLLEFLDAPAMSEISLSSPVCYANSPEVRPDSQG